MTFLGGTCINAGSYWVLRDIPVSKVLLYWQYALIMQLVEGVAWIQYNDNMDLKVVSAFALFFNVTQPIVLALVIKFGIKAPIRHALIANVMYTALLLTDRVWAFSDIAPAPECNHLELRYWNVPRTTLYMLATLISFSEIPDRVWALVNMSIFLGSLFLAMIITACGVGSLFCWLIFMSGVVLVAVRYARRVDANFQNGRIRVTLQAG